MALSVTKYFSFLLICLISYTCGKVHGQASTKVITPPLIVREPLKEEVFREFEVKELPCVATWDPGEPELTYSWEMNGRRFEPSGADGRITLLPDVGTLLFTRPIERDEGQYQCFAENQLGRAASIKINLRRAYLEPFPPTSVLHFRPYLGYSLIMRCIPPQSFPEASVFWATMYSGQSLEPLYLTDRITQDAEGNLYFVNILEEDNVGGRTYVCIVQNAFLRQIQQGAQSVIQTQGAIPQRYAPAILWHPPSQQVALKGTTWKIKCIFSGSPTPRVDWQGIERELPPRYRLESFGQELVVEDLQFEDAGSYECMGINEEVSTPVRRQFNLFVESEPFWIRKPQSVDVAEYTTFTFYCEARGVPEPKVSWYLNGVPIEMVNTNSRIIAENSTLTIINATMYDTQVIQCNVSNVHGYIFTNAYINVLQPQPPYIIEPPIIGQKAAEDQTINVTCTVYGVPKPLVTWYKDAEQLTDGRFEVFNDGHLQISNVSQSDIGNYSCSATNNHGEVTETGSLIVRRKTEIITKPSDLVVRYGSDVNFVCNATTDSEEMMNLKIDWKRKGEIIDFDLARRLFKNEIIDNSLTLFGVISLDSGEYTCVACNGLDCDEASAQLIVQEPPDHPYRIQVVCLSQEGKAEIEWTPGRDNNAPILNYIIQFNTSFAPDNWIDIASNISASLLSYVVDLSPWGNYTFRMLARNVIGTSYPSWHTTTVCRTEPAPPFKNPEHVIAEGDSPSNLAVYWTPMSKLEQNGEGFRYILSWQRIDDPSGIMNHQVINTPETWHYIIDVPPGTPPYTAYYVSVKSSNYLGDAIEMPLTILGHSGEDVPLVFPEGITVDEDSITSSTAVLRWTQVDTSPTTIRGFFRGYKIQFAKQSEWPENIHEQDYLIHDQDLHEQSVNYTVKYLPPNSVVKVQVRVLNKFYAGPPSVPITFKTDVGVPGPPALFEVTIRGSTEFEFHWAEPWETNGNLTGYEISYRQMTGLNLGPLYKTYIMDPAATTTKLTNLHPDTYYRVYLSAVSIKGTGEAIFLDKKTLQASAPNPPTFQVIDVTEKTANIEWVPSRIGNPGNVFYVQYRVSGSEEWINLSDENRDHQMYIFNLESATVYQIRVVATIDENVEAPADLQEFRTKGVDLTISTSSCFYPLENIVQVQYMHKLFENDGSRKVTVYILNVPASYKPYPEDATEIPARDNGYQLTNVSLANGAIRFNVSGNFEEEQFLMEVIAEILFTGDVESNVVAIDVADTCPGSATLTPPIPPTTTLPADSIMHCCVVNNVQPHCRHLCDYFIVHSQVAVDVYLSCVQDLAQVLACGVDDRNLEPCCKQRGVSDHCLEYCSFTQSNVSTFSVGWSVLQCTHYINDAVKCMQEGKATPTTTPSITSPVTIDFCASNPCINGGTCMSEDSRYSCVCLTGFTGNTCEILDTISAADQIRHSIDNILLVLICMVAKAACNWI